MSSLLARASAIIPMVAAADQTGKEGYLVEVASNTTASVCNSATDAPFGVILDGAASGERSSIGVLGGLSGTVRVKLGAAVTNMGAMLELRADGTVGPDDGAGARVIVGRACELGVADEKIEAVLFNPIVFTS